MARTTCDDAGLALDMPTLHGKVMGRSLDHFRSEGAKLIPQPIEPAA